MKNRRFNSLYKELMVFANATQCTEKVLRIEDKNWLERVLMICGPQMIPNKKQLQLNEFYEAAIHLPTGAIIIASRAATIPSKTLGYSSGYEVQYQSFAIYMPGLGIEVANVGRVGEVHSRSFVLRSESACTPSMLFGSQQCNCASQWRCTQELAAYFNSHNIPENEKIGFLMVYLESQNGMGMGYSPDAFAHDLGMRAQLRHAAGLAVSQKHQLSIRETFEALGLPQDPRAAANGVGYKITPIILDFLNAHSNPILLSNNPMKIEGLKKFGYSPCRLKTVGEITQKNESESKQRAQEFKHMDIGSEIISFDAEYHRLKNQIQTTYDNRSAYVS